MKNEIYLKAGRVELIREEVEELQETNRVYIVAYRDIYQINHSNAQGRAFAMSAKGVNNLLGFKLLNE